MKKTFLSMALLVAMTGLFSQSAYYDAIALAEYIDRQASPPVFHNDEPALVSISGILLKYCPDLPGETGYHNVISAITTDHPGNMDYNPLLSPFLQVILPERIAEVSVRPVFPSAGNLDVTAFTEGLATFLIERGKEELNLSFFRKFREFFNQYPEIGIIFPESCRLMQQIPSFHYTAMLPSLKAAFQRDFDNFSSSLLNLRDTTNYAGYATDERIRERADEIVQFFQTLKGRQIAGAILIADEIKKGTNAPEILNRMAGDPICSSHPDDNFSNFIRFAGLISSSLRSGEEGRAWITQYQAESLMRDEIALKIFLGLLYSSDKTALHPVVFRTGNSTVTLLDVLENIYFNWMSGSAIQFGQSFAGLSASLAETSGLAHGLMNSARQGENNMDLSYSVYFNALVRSINEMAGLVSALTSSNTDFSGMSSDLDRFGEMLGIAAAAYLDSRSQDYGSLALRISSMLDEIPGPDHYPGDEFLRYAIFMANIAGAKSSDEVHAAIEAAVLPPGSSSVKRETDFNISLNAFIGPYAGIEYLPELKTGRWAFTAGLTAPAGVALSWGNLGKNRQRPDGKETGGKSLSLFVPLIDIGAMASFRMGNDSSQVASEVNLSNIISPGLYVYYGFGKCPVSAGLGIQAGPQLRKVTATDVNIDKNFYFRFGFNIVVDIPLFNIYTRN